MDGRIAIAVVVGLSVIAERWGAERLGRGWVTGVEKISVGDGFV